MKQVTTHKEVLIGKHGIYKTEAEYEAAVKKFAEAICNGEIQPREPDEDDDDETTR